MCRKTAMHLLIGLACSLSCLAAGARAAERPVASLPAHLAESGIPTEGEVAMAEGWLKAIAPDDAGKPLRAGVVRRLDRDGAAVQLFLRRPCVFRRRQRLEVPARGRPAEGRCRNARLELAARQDRPEGRLAHQAVSGLSGRRYASDVREHRQQGYGADRGREKPRSEVESNAAGKDVHGSWGLRRPLRPRRPHAILANGSRGRQPVRRSVPTGVEAASPGRRKVGGRQIDPQNAFDDRRSEVRAWAGHPCQQPDCDSFAQADRTVFGVGRRRPQRAHARRSGFDRVFRVDGKGRAVSLESASRRPGGGESRRGRQGRHNALLERGRRGRRDSVRSRRLGRCRGCA